MPTAYVFIHCTAGSEERLISEIAMVQDVKEVRGTYGIHDIVVKVKSQYSETMTKIITNTIRRLPGITSTSTLVAIEEQGGKEYTDAVDLHGS